MAYSIAWDETSPDGSTTPANQIDTELQNIKVSVRERLEDVFPDWDNDAVDPKQPTGLLASGATGEKPAAPTFDGQRFYDETLEIEYVGTDVGGTPTWVIVGNTSEAIANIPTGAVQEGARFWATDEGIEYIYLSGAWAVKSLPRVRVYLTGVEATTDAVLKVIPWDAAAVETPTTWWDVGSPTQLVIPLDGWYIITLNTVLDGGGGFSHYVVIKEGSNVIACGGASDGIYNGCTAHIELTASDVITAELYQDSGTSRNITTASYLSASKIG